MPSVPLLEVQRRLLEDIKEYGRVGAQVQVVRNEGHRWPDACREGLFEVQGGQAKKPVLHQQVHAGWHAGATAPSLPRQLIQSALLHADVHVGP